MPSLFEDPLVPRVVRWWKASGVGQRAAVLLFLLGGGLVATSLVPGSGYDDAWLRDFLMTLGSSLALFAPFYLVTRAIDGHLNSVERRTALKVEAVRTEAAEGRADFERQVGALRAEVDRRLTDTAARLTDALDGQAAADRAAFERLRTSGVAREVVEDALTRALALGLIDPQRPPRVAASAARNLYVAFAYDNEWNQTTLLLEAWDGEVLDSLPWLARREALAYLVDLGRAVEKHAGTKLDVVALFGGLADLLEAAHSHPERRPAVQLCSPQWLICRWGLAAVDRTYTVGLPQLRNSPHLVAHVAAKTWVDDASWSEAYGTAVALFPPPPPPLPW